MWAWYLAAAVLVSYFGAYFWGRTTHETGVLDFSCDTSFAVVSRSGAAVCRAFSPLLKLEEVLTGRTTYLLVLPSPEEALAELARSGKYRRRTSWFQTVGAEPATAPADQQAGQSRPTRAKYPDRNTSGALW